MTPEQFAYWLQGFAELTPDVPSPAQWQAIRDHLQLVFEKKTPPVGQPPAGPLFRTMELRPSDQLPPAVRNWLDRIDKMNQPTITC